MKRSDIAVIFDMDGIIFDSERLVLDCWERIGEKYGIPDIGEVFMRCIGTNRVRTRQIVDEHYGKTFPYEKFSAESSALFHEMTEKEGLPIKAGVREILTYLREEKIPLGLASSTRIAVVTQELKDAGLYEYFQTVVGGDLLENSKPTMASDRRTARVCIPLWCRICCRLRRR